MWYIYIYIYMYFRCTRMYSCTYILKPAHEVQKAKNSQNYDISGKKVVTEPIQRYAAWH